MRPLHKQRWDEVAAAYNDHIAGKDFCARDADALKRRFMVLAYAKKPSGTRAHDTGCRSGTRGDADCQRRR